MKRDSKGRFIKGIRYNQSTEFKKGKHWRKKKPYWDKDWLLNEYINKQRSASEIALNFDCKRNNILYFLHKHNIPVRNTSEARTIKYWGVNGEKNGMFEMVGPDNPNWKGGSTPFRQSMYSSPKWKRINRKVRNRHKGCFLCDSNSRRDIHHIVPILDDVTSIFDEGNLIPLCKSCHRWIHSNKNKRIGGVLLGESWRH